MNFSEQSLLLHKKHQGKIATALKVPLENQEDLSQAYTPGVAAVSLAVAENPALAKDLTIKANTIAVVSDGSAVLGLGNLGALGALPVMEGKCALFKRFGGVDAFPLCLDTQDTEDIIKTIKAIAPVFGGINLEDISAPRCFEIESRLQNELEMPVMHDDQHGTAVVVLAALINALRLVGKAPNQVKIVINGAGAAGTAIAGLLHKYGIAELVICDSNGIISRNREDLNQDKAKLLDYTNPKNLSGKLAEALSGADVFIGVSKAYALSPAHIETMATKPIVFALANPVPEIMPEDALLAGAFIYASGRSDFPNQINNVLAFPGLFKGALRNGIKKFESKHFLAAAEAIASAIANPTPSMIIPHPFTERLADKVATCVN